MGIFDAFNFDTTKISTDITHNLINQCMSQVESSITNNATNSAVGSQVMNVTISPTAVLNCSLNIGQSMSLDIGSVQTAVNNITSSQSTDLKQAIDNAMKADIVQIPGSGAVASLVNVASTDVQSRISSNLQNIVQSSIRNSVQTVLTNQTNSGQVLNITFSGVINAPPGSPYCNFTQDTVIKSIMDQATQTAMNSSQGVSIQQDIKTILDTKVKQTAGDLTMMILLIIGLVIGYYFFFGKNKDDKNKDGSGSSGISITSMIIIAICIIVLLAFLYYYFNK